MQKDTNILLCRCTMTAVMYFGTKKNLYCFIFSVCMLLLLRFDLRFFVMIQNVNVFHRKGHMMYAGSLKRKRSAYKTNKHGLSFCLNIYNI